MGVVVTNEGEPIAGARIKSFFVAGPSQSWYHWCRRTRRWPPRTRPGRFTLDRLEDEKTYALLIETETQGRRVVTGVVPGRERLAAGRSVPAG